MSSFDKIISPAKPAVGWLRRAISWAALISAAVPLIVLVAIAAVFIAGAAAIIVVAIAFVVICFVLCLIPGALLCLCIIAAIAADSRMAAKIAQERNGNI
jgi:hypothetical protein